MARGNLGGTSLIFGDINLAELNWSDNEREASLSKVVEYAHSLAEEARDWYNQGKKSKQRSAKFLRVAAIFATAVAGIFPILTQIFTTNGVPDVDPAWASIALGVAATCIGLDRFFGFSSGWLRYIEAQTKIRNAIQIFAIDCQLEKLSWTNPTPALNQSKRLIVRAQALITEVNGIIEDETKKWANEFRDALGKLEETAKEIEEAAPAEQLGAINLTVTNGKSCDDGWFISIDGGVEQKRSGETATLAHLVPGLRIVSIAGMVSGKPMQAEKTVTVVARTVQDIEFTLT
jgi:hypothetical protein